jgi:plastocyanin
MGRRRRIGIAAVGAVAALLTLMGSVGAASAAHVTIGEAANRYHFSPTTTFVNVGGTVTWTNGSDAAHTVTSDSVSELGSPTFNAGKSFSHTFAATGTFTYHCTIHTYMTGKVVVLAAGAALPATDTAMTPATTGLNVGLTGLLFLLAVGGGTLALRRLRRAA